MENYQVTNKLIEIISNYNLTAPQNMYDVINDKMADELIDLVLDIMKKEEFFIIHSERKRQLINDQLMNNQDKE